MVGPGLHAADGLGSQGKRGVDAEPRIVDQPAWIWLLANALSGHGGVELLARRFETARRSGAEGEFYCGRRAKHGQNSLEDRSQDRLGVVFGPNGAEE